VEVTLLADNGQIIRVAGPSRRPLAELARGRAPSLSLGRLADLLRGGGPGRFQPAFSRSGIGGAQTDPWAVDVTTGGAKCIFADHPVFLWRPPLASGARVSLEATSRSQRSFFDWPAGTITVAWPSDIPLDPSETYVVTLDSGSRTFTLTVAPKRPERGFALVHLAESGCKDQLFALLGSVERGQD
jgi:hypothetical protein